MSEPTFTVEEYKMFFYNAKVLGIDQEDAALILAIVESTIPEESFGEKLAHFLALCHGYKVKDPSFMDTFEKAKKEVNK